MMQTRRFAALYFLAGGRLYDVYQNRPETGENAPKCMKNEGGNTQGQTQGQDGREGRDAAASALAVGWRGGLRLRRAV